VSFADDQSIQSSVSVRLVSWRRSTAKQETHEIAQRKVEQMDKLKAALGLADVVEGEAFDPEVQVRRRN
jgi:hypothetical protein